MKKYITPLGLASALLITSCAKDDFSAVPQNDSDKTAIEFSMTDNSTGKVTISGQSRTGFSAETGIVMRMAATSSTDNSVAKYTKTTATAAAGENLSNLSFIADNSNGTRYWDDAFGRNTLLSIYAVAVPGKTNAIDATKVSGDNTWSTTATDNKLNWQLSTTQTTENIANEDLVYSNNIQESFTEYNQKNGVYQYDFTNNNYPNFDGTNFSTLTAGQMQFRLKSSTATDGPGKFDKGNLNFVHALSRITLNITLDTEKGFTGNETVSNVKMIEMPTSGSFDMQEGQFTSTSGVVKGSTVAMAAIDDTNKSYLGQVLPGYDFAEANNGNVLQFEVDNNIYYVTQAKIYEALNTTANQSNLKFSDNTKASIIMQQGQNYVLNVTINKTKIENLSATLADWTNISGDYTRNNAYLSFTFSNYGGTASNLFSLYRSAHTYDNYVVDEGYTKDYTWDANYGDMAKLTEPTEGSNIWKTNWYWNDNKTFYHFRMIGNPSASVSSVIKTDKDNNKQYFEIISGATDGAFRWGAPMISGKTLGYDLTNGFDVSSTDHHISHAIGATESEIHFTEVNLLSHIKVIIKTTTGDDKVELYNSSKNGMTNVNLTNYFASGKVYLGTGLVAINGNLRTTSTQMPAPTAPTESPAYAIEGSYDYYVVPQSLTGEEKVGLTINTPDNNVYYVVEDLSKIKASAVTNGSNISIGQSVGDYITYWYPNCLYTYTITLKKAGAYTISATLVPYTEISGSTDITIED